MARMADQVVQKCTLQGAEASWVVQFLGLDPKIANKIAMKAAQGYQAPLDNEMVWDPKTNTIILGPHWEDWKTGTASQNEGPRFQFQIHAPLFLKENPLIWDALVNSLKKSKNQEFETGQDIGKILGSKRFVFSTGLFSKEYLTLELFHVDFKSESEALRYGASAEDNMVFVSCGPWQKR